MGLVVIDAILAIVGAILILVGSGSYLIGTLKGTTKPNRVTWLLWATAPFVAFSGEWQHGVGWPSLMTFMVGFGPLLIFIGSFFNQHSAWDLCCLDVVCGVFSVLGIVLWQLTSNGNLAIAFAILADALAALPTIVKSHKYPKTENWHFSLFYGLSAILTLLAVDSWNFAHVAFPVYILVLSLLLVILIKIKPQLARQPAI